MILLEAMPSGCPIVGTDVGGVSTAVIDNRNGLLVPTGDVENLAEKIIYLLNDEVLRKQLGQNGTKLFQENFLAETMTAKYQRLYKRQELND